jgi:hypothetical protein
MAVADLPHPFIRVKLAVLLTVILKKHKRRLVGLQFDYLPLYRIVDEILFPPRRLPPSLAMTGSVGAWIVLAKKARRWFASDSTMLIIEKVKGDLDVQDWDRMTRAICLLTIFVQSARSEELLELLAPESFIWAAGSKRFEVLLFTTLARAAKYTTSVRWSDKIAFYMGIMNRHLKLPQPEANEQSGEKMLYRHKTSLGTVRNEFPSAARAFGKFLAHALVKDHLVLEQLRTFMLGLDSYCHPSNVGRWTEEISNMISRNIEVMARIVSLDMDGSIPTEIKAEYVRIMWEAVKKLVFGKHPMTVLAASNAARHLIYLHRETVESELLGMAASSLVVASEPHRTVSYINLLARSTRLQVEGESDILEILPYCTPGLDPSDMPKTISTIYLFCTVFYCMPLVPFEGEMVSVSGPVLEELVSAILDQSFAYISNQATENVAQDGEQQVEKHLFAIFGQLWTLMFNQMGEELWLYASERVRNFVLKSRGAGATVLVTKLLQASKGCYVDKTIRELFIPLMDTIEREINNGTGTSVKATEDACSGLIWYLAALLGLVRNSEDSLLPHISRIKGLVVLFGGLRQKTCAILAARILKALIRSWTDYYPKQLLDSTDRLGLAQEPVRTMRVQIDWHYPTNDGKAAAEQLLKVWNEVIKDLSTSSEDATKVRLSFATYLAYSCIIADHVKYALLLKGIQASCLEVAMSGKVSVEVRGRALAVILNVLNYYGTPLGRLDSLRMQADNWAHMLRNYPKQRMLPPMLQMRWCHLMHRRWMARKLSRWTIDDGVVLKLTELALGSYSMLRIISQSILGAVASIEPHRTIDWIFEELIPRVRATPEETVVKGAMHTLRMQSFLQLITPNLARAEKVIEVAMGLLGSVNGSTPGLLELIGKFLSDVCVNVHPDLRTTVDLSVVYGTLGIQPDLATEFEMIFNMPAVMDKYIALYKRPDTAWKTQLICVLFVAILAEAVTDIELLGRAARFYLTCMQSEVTPIRSIAVNRGIMVLTRYFRHLSGVDFDIDEMDRNGAWSMTMVVPTESKVTDVLPTFLPIMVKWVAQEGNGNSQDTAGIPPFRPDIAELFQCLAEFVGIEILSQVENSLERVPHKTSMAYQRACAEIFAGIARGLAVTRADVMMTLRDAGRKWMIVGGVDSGPLWYETARFMADSLAPDRLDYLVKGSPLKDDEASVLLAIKMQFIAGFLRACPHDEIAHEMKGKVVDMLGSPYDVVRRYAARLLVAVSVCDSQTLYNLDFNSFLKTIPLSKAFLILVEKMAVDPLRTGLWRRLADIVGVLVKIHASADAELQRESRRIVKVLAWTCYESNQGHDTIIKVANIASDPSCSANARRLAMEFAHLFYARNFVALTTVGDDILEAYFSFLSDESADVRQETGELFANVFHSSPKLAAEWKTRLDREIICMKQNIKDTLGVPTRHGMILAAAALVKSHPYTVPTWLPSLLALLTRFVNDRYPISDTARKTLSEFRRTHGEDWEHVRELFTEREFDALDELLVAPSYYA